MKMPGSVAMRQGLNTAMAGRKPDASWTALLADAVTALGEPAASIRTADLKKGPREATSLYLLCLYGVAVLLSVELCSLTLQRQDLSIPNLIASGLFGDGAAAAVVVGNGHEAAGPKILDSRSVFYRDSEDVMGWSISEEGFRIVLSAEVPEVVRRHLRHDVDEFLDDHGLTRDNVAVWVSHPGGPKVLEAMQEALELPDEALQSAWRSLREVGNLSSTSVLLVLQDTMENSAPDAGSYGVMLAMGPGFCSELVLLRW